MIRVTCLGGAGGVTGSQYYLETSRGKKLLVDCGLFQGGKLQEAKNFGPWGFSPKDIPTLILTHAHIDHCGRIPKLVKDGFSGKILATAPTIDLCRILLLDSAHIQEMNAEWQTMKNRRQAKKAVQPLYTTADAEQSLGLFSPVERDVMTEIEPGVKLRLRNAGHILGSCIAELWIEDGDETVKVVFSGDLGKGDQLIVRDAHEIFNADYVFMESTYGNRFHRSFEDSKAELLECIEYASKNGEKVMIPSFAVERTQEILYVLSEFHRAGKLPDIPVYLDSPLAIKATDIFRKYRKEYDEEAQAIVSQGVDPFNLPNLKATLTAAQSAAINEKNGPAIVIAGNGMCTAGRIKFHLKYNLWRPGACLVFVGFQAGGSTGRKIIEGAKSVKILREMVAVKAKVATIGGFSAHADQNDLLEWVGHFTECKPRIFLVHGETGAKEALSEKISQQFGLPVHIPIAGESLLLSPRGLKVEKPAQEAVEEENMDSMHNELVDMENILRQLKKELPERWSRQKDGDHGFERLQFIHEELRSLLNHENGA